MTRALQIRIKRAFDILFSAGALFLLAPFLALIGLLVKLESPGPAVLKQHRIGKDARIFGMYKFRSMVHDASPVSSADGSYLVVEGDPRVTPLGAKLRRFGLDELPQLINVLKGEMSLIGPRPDMDVQLRYYTDNDYRKLAMLPGISSLAQVSGRNLLSWKERRALEIDYVEKFSLLLDLRIAWRTVGVVVAAVGVCNLAPHLESDDHQS